MKRSEIDKDKVLRGISIEIKPTEEQKAYIEKCINATRYVYNWAIDQEYTQRQLFEYDQEEKSFLTKKELCKEFKKLRDKTDWLKEIPCHVLRSGIDDAISAFRNNFNNAKNYGKPKFKTKKDSKQSVRFRTDGTSFYIEGNLIRLEGMPGNTIKSNWKSGYVKEANPKIYRATITVTKSGKYHFSFSTYRDKKTKRYFEERNIPESEVIGIDLNLHKRFALSNGKSFIGPDLSKHNRRINYLQVKNSKDASRLKEMERTNPDVTPKKSNRMLRRQRNLAKAYEKKYNKIETFIQETTKHIIDMHPKAVVMEKLDVADMLSKHYIAKQITDACFYRCREVMQYKCEEYNIPFMLAPREYQSSQICSCCGEIKEEKLRSYRVFVCHKCGNRMDRDLNAAINLSHLYNVS